MSVSNSGPCSVNFYRVSDNHLHKLHVLHNNCPVHKVLNHLNGDQVGEGAEEPIDHVDCTLRHKPSSQDCAAQSSDHGSYKIFTGSWTESSHSSQFWDQVEGLHAVRQGRKVGKVILNWLHEGDDVMYAGSVGHLDVEQEDTHNGQGNLEIRKNKNFTSKTFNETHHWHLHCQD